MNKEEFNKMCENFLVVRKIKHLFESFEDMYDSLELGGDSQMKRTLFTMLQDIALTKGLILNRQELKDQITGNILVNKSTSNPLKHIFDALDLDILINMPWNEIQPSDIQQAHKNTLAAKITTENMNQFSLIIVVTNSQIKDPAEIIKILNVALSPLNATITLSDEHDGKLVTQFNFNIMTPFHVTKNDIEKALSDSQDVLKMLHVNDIHVNKIK